MNLTLGYQTQNLPAPYAFSATFRLSLASKSVAVDFELCYLDREELSQEEILAEGFSLEDDFAWKGHLGPNWIEPLQAIRESKTLDHPKDSFYLEINSDGKTTYPNIPSDVIIQELLQAVFEAAEREMPMTVMLYQNSKKVELKWEFSLRLFTIDGKSQSWEKGFELMETIYSQPLDNLKPSKKPKEKSVSLDGQSWVPFSQPKLWSQLAKLKTSENDYLPSN